MDPCKYYRKVVQSNTALDCPRLTSNQGVPDTPRSGQSQISPTRPTGRSTCSRVSIRVARPCEAARTGVGGAR